MTAPSPVTGEASDVGSVHVAHTFEDLVDKQRTADQAHAHVVALQTEYGRPTQEGGWTDEQTTTYNSAWTKWRDSAEAVQAAIRAHADEQGKARIEVEQDVKKAARHPDDSEA